MCIIRMYTDNRISDYHQEVSAQWMISWQVKTKFPQYFLETSLSIAKPSVIDTLYDYVSWLYMRIVQH